MAVTQPEKAFCILEFAKTESWTLVQRALFSCPDLPGLLISDLQFRLWRFVKGLVYVPLLPKDVDKLKARKTEAVTAIDNEMLERVWQELDYRFDVCRVTNSAHIEHL